jgi:hypothetical protein
MIADWRGTVSNEPNAARDHQLFKTSHVLMLYARRTSSPTAFVYYTFDWSLSAAVSGEIHVGNGRVEE